MVEFPYILKPNAVKEMLSKIQDATVPPRVTMKYIESLGLKAKNDRPVIAVLKYIGFLDNSGVPTEMYKQYRNKSKSKVVLAQCIKKSYKKLFDVYSDAYRKDNESLRNFFSTHTTAGAEVLKKTVSTFKVLCEFADFESDVPINMEEGEQSVDLASKPPISMKGVTAPSVNINIELHIPATDDAKVYDNLFASLKKHLFDE